ncbi:MAG: glycoside hydrolase [Myxococcota bacterium]
MNRTKPMWLLLSLCLHADPALAQDKRVYIALDDHTDYMWTADEATYQTTFLTTLDYYLNQADATSAEASAYQSRFNTDGTFWLWTYEKNKSTTEFERLISRVKSGHISVPMNALVSTYGGQPTEAILRGMYYAGSLERRYNLDLTQVHSMENQTLPYGLGALWAGAGAKYSWRGICGCVSQVPSAWDRPYDAYYWTGPDGSKILMKWNSMLTGNNAFMGGYAEARDTSTVIDYVSSNSSFQARWPYQVIGAFGYGWDDLQTLNSNFPSIAKSKSSSSRQVIVSNQEDFFIDLEKTHGSIIPSMGVSFGNEWDLYSASMMEVSSSVKRAVEQLRGAEALATLVSLEDPTFMQGREQARDTAWMNLGLYWEHDWTADGPVSRDARREWQRRMAAGITSYVDTLQKDAITRLGMLIQNSSTAPRYFVFNALSWDRDDVAELEWSGSTPVHVVEVERGTEVPSQVLSRDGKTYLQLWAGNVPALGYRTYEVRTGAGQTFSNAASVASNVVENGSLKITFSERGAITSLIDKKRNNRELATTISGLALNDLGSGTGTLTVEQLGPVTVTLKATATGPLAHTTRLTLNRGEERITLDNTITQGFSDVRSWAFSANLSSPVVHHEEVGALVRARLSTDGGVYATRNARYDWLSVQHFADLSDGAGTGGLTLSNQDLAFMKLGNSTTSVLDVNISQLKLLAGGQVDGTHLGIPNQGGDTRFTQRFALRAHGGYDPSDAMRFALAHQNPLLVGAIPGGGSALPEGSYTLGLVSDPQVLVWSLKPADDGIDTGMVVRLWNMASASKSASFTSTRALTSAQRLTHVETPVETLALNGATLNLSLAAQQLSTVLLTLESSSTGDDGSSGGCSGAGNRVELLLSERLSLKETGDAAETVVGGRTESSKRAHYGVGLCLGVGLLGMWRRRKAA